MGAEIETCKEPAKTASQLEHLTEQAEPPAPQRSKGGKGDDYQVDDVQSMPRPVWMARIVAKPIRKAATPNTSHGMSLKRSLRA